MSLIDYTIKAIPTEYRGRRYRSRLEAKWAAFFDLAEWRHEYEPLDMGDWSPDFSIVAGDTGQHLVEVKPIQSFNSVVADKILFASRLFGFQGRLLLLGLGPIQRSSGIQIGWGCFLGNNPEISSHPYAWSDAMVYQNDTDLPLGVYQVFDDDVGVPTDLCSDTVANYWGNASNAVQWRARGVSR